MQIGAKTIDREIVLIVLTVYLVNIWYSMLEKVLVRYCMNCDAHFNGCLIYSHGPYPMIFIFCLCGFAMHQWVPNFKSLHC